ncbi:MAG: hypothetical protein P8X94_08015 [Woeseiaceae bacterium]
MAGKLKTEVQQLADAAMQAAAYERECRVDLTARARKTVRKGLVIGAVSIGGFMLVSTLLDRRHRDEDGKKRDDSRGVFERAGDMFMTLVRWGATASHLWTLGFSPQQPPVGTLPDA